jgi:hypothetical protein
MLTVRRTTRSSATLMDSLRRTTHLCGSRSSSSAARPSACRESECSGYIPSAFRRPGVGRVKSDRRLEPTHPYLSRKAARLSDTHREECVKRRQSPILPSAELLTVDRDIANGATGETGSNDDWEGCIQ